MKFVWISLALVTILCGCNEKINTNQTISDPASDPQASYYRASMADGIDFSKPKFPDFVAEVSGLSGHENFGYWTEKPVVKFRFKQPLPRSFTLLLSFGSISPNVGKPVTVRAGTIERKLLVAAPEGKAYILHFEGVDNADTLEFILPTVRPVDLDPASIDTRQLGLALISLRVR